jgi:hypothetical protein
LTDARGSHGHRDLAAELRLRDLDHRERYVNYRSDKAGTA